MQAATAKYRIDIPTLGRAYFRVHPTDPVFEPLGETGFYFVNPRCASTDYHPMGAAEYQIIQSHRLVFASDAEPDFRDGLPTIRKFLDYLRPISAQVALPTRTVPASGYDRHEMRLSPWPAFGGTANTRADWIKTALTFETVRFAAKIMGDEPDLLVPSLMLDAIEAWNRDDYRRAIVFSAIAMEAQVQTVLDAVVDAGTTNGTGNDGVYALLKRNRDFKHRLHELPLYVFGESLRDSDKDAYDSALGLYSTRNKVVHTGTVPDEKPHLFPLNNEGAKQAIAAAASVVRWFGLGLDYSGAIDDATIPCGGSA